MHETEISVVSISVQEQKDEVLSMPRKHKRELNDFQVGMKYHMIYKGVGTKRREK